MSDARLFQYLRNKHGPNLYSKGIADIGINDIDLTPQLARGIKHLTEENDRNIFYLFTEPGSYVRFDLKRFISIKMIQIHGCKHDYAYPWNTYPPSYSIQFSTNDIQYENVYQESNSMRITQSILDTFYIFKLNKKYRYIKLLMTDYVQGSHNHGLYLSWVEFFTDPFDGMCSKNDFYTCYHSKFLIYISSIIIDL